MMSFPIRLASVGLIALLLLGSVIPTSAAPEDGDKPRGGLPADLALVTDDALGFATFRIADLVENKGAKQLLSLFPGSSRETLLQAIENDTGLKGGSIERFTLVHRRLGAGFVWLIRTTKAYDKEAVLKQMGDPVETKMSGKTIFASKARSKFGPTHAVWMPDGRTLVQGQPQALAPYLAALSRPGKERPFVHELKVASCKHAVVVAMRPSLIVRTLDAESRVMRRFEMKSVPKYKSSQPKEAPPATSKCGDPADAPPAPPEQGRRGSDPADVEEQPLKLRSLEEIADGPDGGMVSVLMPVIRARRALLTIDLDDRFALRARADFDSKDDIEDAEVLARMGLYLLRETFPAILRREMRLDMKAKGLAALFSQFKADVRAVEVKRDGKTLELTGNLKIDPAPFAAYLTEMVPIRTDENNLKQIGLSFHMYHDTYGYMPQAAICDKAGKPLLSWRVAILPYIEQGALYNQFKLDEAWDSPHNKKLLDKMPKIYAPPAGKVDEPNVTFYQVFTGPNTLYPRPNSQVRLATIPDGTSNTLMVVEASKAVPWTKPVDIVVPAKGHLPKLGGQFARFFNAAWCDGSVRRIKRDFDQKVMRNAIDPADGNVLEDRKLDP